MLDTTKIPTPILNRILAALPSEKYRRLLPQMEQIDLTFGEKIYEQGEIIKHVYFPNCGIISLLSTIGKDSMLEIGIVGREGMVGLSVFLGVETSSYLAMVQGKGLAMKMKAADFLKECQKSEDLTYIIHRFTHSLLTQMSQSSVCFRFHPIEARLSRWLLMTADRMESNEFQITQEFLSNMVGVRREAVNKAAVILQQQHLISYIRGNITIVDRAGLEKATCQCYSIIKAKEISFPSS